MRGTIFAILAAAFLVPVTGCQPLADDAFREALPEEEDLAIKMGKQDTASGALSSALLDVYASCEECCIAGEGDAATYVSGDLYKSTRAAIRSVNGGLGVVFGWIRLITAFHYSSRTSESFTWGPWNETDSDPLSRLSFRFVMTKEADGEFAFKLEAKNVNAGDGAWESLAWGTVSEGDAPHRGAGTLDLDFDRLHQMDSAHPSRLYGKVHYDFDVRRASPTATDPNTVAATFTDFYEKAAWGADPAPVDATYKYWRYAALAGRFEYRATADVAGPEGRPDGLDESLSAEARWTTTGEGRAKAVAESQSVPGITAYQVDECWADQAGLFYETWRRDTATPASGAPWVKTACGAEASCPTF